MSIEVMKQALEALEEVQRYDKTSEWFEKRVSALRQAIAEAEKQEPAFYVIPATDRFGEGYEQTFWEDPAGFPVYTRPVVHAVRCTYPQCQATNGCVGACSKTTPVHASDMSKEPVDETAKDRHISYVCPNCHWSLDKQVRTHTPEDVKKIESKWVGLDDNIPGLGLVTEEFYNGMLCAEDILRKRNTCVEREWVGLTDEEREQVRSSAGYNQFMSAGEYAEAVQWATEAKLKEKNT